MKTKKAGRTAGWALALLMPLGAAAQGLEAGPQRQVLPSEVTKVSVSVDGEASIELAAGGPEFGVDGLVVMGTEAQPLSIERKGDELVVRIDRVRGFLGLKMGKLRAKFKLLVPAGRSLSIAAGKLTLSGETTLSALRLSAGDLEASGLTAAVSGPVSVAAGRASLEMTLRSATTVHIGAGSVSGTLRLPASAHIDTAAGSNKLRLLVKEGA